MDFNSVVAEVIRMTARPDKALSIQALVNSAINFCCLETNFTRDHDEQIVTLLNPTGYVHSIDLSEFTRWRKFSYIKPSNRNKYLNHRTPDLMFQNNKALADVYYITGDTVKVNLCETANTLLVGWFKFPPVLTAESPNFWLLDVSPFMVIYKAASDLFSEVGNTAESNRLQNMFVTAYESAKRDYKHGVSYE